MGDCIHGGRRKKGELALLAPRQASSCILLYVYRSQQQRRSAARPLPRWPPGQDESHQCALRPIHPSAIAPGAPWTSTLCRIIRSIYFSPIDHRPCTPTTRYDCDVRSSVRAPRGRGHSSRRRTRAGSPTCTHTPHSASARRDLVVATSADDARRRTVARFTRDDACCGGIATRHGHGGSRSARRDAHRHCRGRGSCGPRGRGGRQGQARR